MDSRKTDRGTVTCMVTLAGEARRRSVRMTKRRDVLRRVRTLTGTRSRMREERRKCVAILVRRTLRMALTLRQRLSGARPCWQMHQAIRTRVTDFSFDERGRLVGELLQDRKASEGEDVRDHCPNSIAVSFVDDSIFTFARNFHEIGPGTGDLCRRWGSTATLASGRLCRALVAILGHSIALRLIQR